MNQFDQIYDRTGTSEKYDLRERLFGRADVTPMWVADTDFLAPHCVQAALLDRVNHPLYGYQVLRPKETLCAIVGWLETLHGLTVSEEHVLLSPSVVTSMGVAVDAFTQAGDGVGLFTPVYPPFFNIPQYNDRQAVSIPLRKQASRYHIDFEALEKLLPHLKLLIFSHPHNPSGRVWLRDELAQLLTMCQRAGVIIFSDEIHADLVHAPNQHCPFLSLPGAKDTVVMAHSIGKTFNCAGLRASYVVIPSEKLREQFFAAQKKTHTDEISCLGKVAIAAALSDGGLAYRKALLPYLAENIDLVCSILGDGLPQVQVMRPESTFLVWVDFSALPFSEDILRSRLIDEAGVGFSDGKSFGEPGVGFYRINIGLQKRILISALERVVNVLSA